MKFSSQLLFFHIAFRIVVSTTSGIISCYDSNFCLKWTAQFGPIFGDLKPALFCGGSSQESEVSHIIFGSVDCYLRCLRIEDGHSVWVFRSDAAIFGSAAIHQSSRSTIFGANDKKARKLMLHAGELVWETELDAKIFATPCFVNQGRECVFATTSGRVYWLNSDTGVRLKETDVGAEIFSSPAPINTPSCEEYDTSCCSDVIVGARNDFVFRLL